MRILYSLLMLLALPIWAVYFALRGCRDHRYWQHWGERLSLGQPTGPFDAHVHAASLGEVNAAGPLVAALLAQQPAPRVLITTFTPTGRQRVQELFDDRVALAYLPLDLSSLARRFLARVQPTQVLVIETEIWPNFYRAVARAEIPLLIINARLSRKSLRGYARFQGLIGPALGSVRRILAQSERDARRFIRCGAPAERVSNAGNLKFDINIPPSLLETGELLRASWGNHRPVFVAGSTHEDDERVLLAAFLRVLEQHPTALLVLAPRHPERFSRTEQAVRDAGLALALRSHGGVPPRGTQCLIIDTMGELLNYYAAADVAFVGGTIAEIGGHNLLEPAALGKPQLFGPHTAHVKEIATRLLESGAARRVLTPRDVAEIVNQLFSHPATKDRMGQAGLKLVSQGRGALQRSLDAIEAEAPRAGDRSA